jgi:hypothetical protein
MDLASIFKIGTAIIRALPTLESSIAAIVALISHVHSVSDAVTAGEAVVEAMPALLDAAVTNTQPTQLTTQASVTNAQLLGQAPARTPGPI